MVPSRSEQRAELMILIQEERRTIQRLLSFMERFSQFWTFEAEEEVYQVVEATLAVFFPAVNGRLFLVNDSRTKLQFAACHPGVVDPGNERCSLSPNRCPAIRRGKPFLAQRIPEEITCSRLNDFASLSTHFCLPLAFDGFALGVLSLVWSRGGPTQEDLGIVNLLVEQVSFALANVRVLNRYNSLTTSDELTGLHNRRYAMETIDKEIGRSRRYSHPFSVAVLDLDNFKKVNDTFGHQEGDRVLRVLAEVAQTSLRSADTAARYGGEEFVFIFPQLDIQQAFLAVERFRQSFTRATLSERYGLKARGLTVSAGIASFPLDGSDGESLLRVADDQLYQAKSAGRDRTVISQKTGTVPTEKNAEPAGTLISDLERGFLLGETAIGVEILDDLDRVSEGEG